MSEITGKKILAIAALAAAVCFSACSKDAPETSSGSLMTTTVSETTIIAENEIEFAEDITEPAAEIYEDITEIEDYSTICPENGLVYFIQPIVKQYDEYDDWHLSDWECRDTEVMRGCHYNGEWNYGKELVFVLSNYTDEPVTVDSIQILRESDETFVSFADGSNVFNIDFTVQPGHKTDYILQAEDFDYSACESGVYNAVVNVGLEGYGREFFIDNEKTYTETYNSSLYGQRSSYEIPAFLDEEQRSVFSQAYGTMHDWFWFEHCLAEEYAASLTVEDFIDIVSNGLTYDYAKALAMGTYIDKNGEFIIQNSTRGMDMSYFGHCFLPVSSDENEVSFKAIVTYCHSDNPYDISFEEKDYHMVNAEDGWRFDKFSLWN